MSIINQDFSKGVLYFSWLLSTKKSSLFYLFGSINNSFYL